MACKIISIKKENIKKNKFIYHIFTKTHLSENSLNERIIAIFVADMCDEYRDKFRI